MKEQDVAPRGDLAHSRDERELSALMRESQAGNRDSYLKLLERIQTLLRPFVNNSLARTSLGAAAGEDVLQEILLGIHAKRATYDPSRFFLPWMYAIARYKVIDHLRLARRFAKQERLAEDDGSSGPGLGSVSTHLATEVGGDGLTGSDATAARLDAESLLGRLPEKQRRLLMLVKLQGLSIQEASLQTGYSPSDVKVSIHRGIKALQKAAPGKSLLKAKETS